jgi:hypothetical protein
MRQEEEMADQYYGVYSAQVTGNDAGEGVLSVIVLAVHPDGQELQAKPCLPYGVLFLPEKDDKVWVQFEGGDSTLPVWTGVQQFGDAWPSDPGPPTARMLRSLKDHRLTLDDDTPAVEMRYGGKEHAVSMTDSAVTVTHDAGHAVTLEQDKVSITVASSGPAVELGQSSATISLGGASVKLEQGSVTISLGGSSVKLDPESVTLSAPLVKLGGAKLPLIRATDTGVGNLGAPVVMTPVQLTVLA